jgi:hypothetical protein
MAHKPRFVTVIGMQFANKRLLLRCGVGPPQQSLVFPWDSMRNYKGSNRPHNEWLCDAWLVCITPGRGCAALGCGWQDQRKALKGRNKWRARQSPVRKPGQSAGVTNSEQRRNAPSIAPRCVSLRETAAPVGGDCCALSGLLGIFLYRQPRAAWPLARLAVTFPGLSCCGPFGAKRRRAVPRGGRRRR